MNVNGFEVKHFPGKHRALDINMHHAKYAHRLNGSEVTVCDSSSECELKKEPDYEFAHPSDLSWPVSRSKHLHDGFDVNGSRVSTMTPADYLASVNHGTLLHDYITSRPSSSATSLRSTTLPDIPSRNSSRFSRHSARGKKRGLSISPSTELTIDLNEIIRTSPNSLVAFINGGGITHGWQSRGSSAASRGSGSYGHLSAASISPSPFQSRAGSSHSMSQSSLFSHRSRPFNVIPKPPSEMPGTMPSSVFKNPAKTSTSLELPPTQTPHVSSSTDDQIAGKQYGWSPAFKEAASNSKQPQVSFDDGISALKHEEVMDESISNSCAEATPMSSIGEYESDEEECEKDEFDLTCRWAKCGVAFENQTSLVHHVNAEHIQKNKKSCSCYWAGCTRESKPFKAMYMLVVHVRRHTGEKPHKCHFEGCNKAYSRLENLKTHVRSHTGERPYVCEFEGCQKAFSNASDRAKHQNRTHSSVKQYGCKVEGCPKRYTDPSSLRKHMKTVHGTIPQPTKKIKGSPSRDFAPEQPASSNASQESEQEQRRQSVAQCLVVKPYSTVADSRGDGPSNAGRVASSASTSAFAMSAALSPNAREYGRPRLGSGSNWSPHLVLGSPFSARVDELNGPDDDALASPGVYLDVQPRLVLPQISKKVNIGASLALSPQAQLSPPSSTKLLNRRDSNTSVTSIDSGAESYSSSRRCSDISLLSYLSSRRSSQASMMASRLSPRNIATQTLIEDQVLEHIPSEDMSHCDATAIASDSCHPSVNNQLSRVSSGYGSQSNYFRAKSPSVNSHDPEFPREIRRASDGNLKRVSDSGFKPTPLPVQFDRHLRRGSEPVSTVQVIDNTPRRKSYSAFDPLPLPASMTRDRPNWNVQTQQAPGLNTFTRPIEEAVGNPAWSTTESAALQQQASRVINASDALQSSGMPRSNLVVKHQEDSLVELLSSPEGMDVQDFRVRGSPKSGVVLACADSTMADPCADHLVDDPLSRFVENLVHSEAPGLQGAHLSHGGPPNYSLANQARFEQQKQQWVLQQRHQVQQGGSHMIGSSPYQTPSNYAFTTAGERNRSFANAQLQSNRLPSFHSQLTQSGGRLPQQQQQQLRPQPPYMGSRGNGTFNQDNRFQSVAVNYEPDSTLEAAEAKQMEDLMVQSLHGLSTKPVDSYMRPPTNMVLNNMNTLLQSLAEENKYFESQALLHDGRYP